MSFRRVMVWAGATIVAGVLASSASAQTAQVPGKAYPVAQAPTKTLPVPGKSLPAAQVPTKTLPAPAPAPQAPGKGYPAGAPQAPVKTAPQA